tara:strand:+ start:698 stop:856 length:159 start_codon:yes stop_codon:yes gene_type:complete
MEVAAARTVVVNKVLVRAAQARTLATEAVVAARAAEARLCCYFSGGPEGKQC